MTADDAREQSAKKTPGWLVAIAAGAMLLTLVMVWTVLPWPAAVMATSAAFLGSELGQIGARWVDDNAR